MESCRLAPSSADLPLFRPDSSFRSCLRFQFYSFHLGFKSLSEISPVVCVLGLIFTFWRLIWGSSTKTSVFVDQVSLEANKLIILLHTFADLLDRSCEIMCSKFSLLCALSGDMRLSACHCVVRSSSYTWLVSRYEFPEILVVFCTAVGPWELNKFVWSIHFKTSHPPGLCVRAYICVSILRMSQTQLIDAWLRF